MGVLAAPAAALRRLPRDGRASRAPVFGRARSGAYDDAGRGGEPAAIEGEATFPTSLIREPSPVSMRGVKTPAL